MDNITGLASMWYEQSFTPPEYDGEYDEEYDEFTELDRIYDAYRDENYEEEGDE